MNAFISIIFSLERFMSKCENLIHNHILYTLQNISTLTTNCFENNLVRNYYNYFFFIKIVVTISLTPALQWRWCNVVANWPSTWNAMEPTRVANSHSSVC